MTARGVAQRRNARAFALAAAAIAWCSLDTATPRLRVLMLGDVGHHRPVELSKILALSLTGSGMDFRYTDQVKDLTAANLAAADVLVLYLNTPELPKENEEALLRFVDGGGGIVALHCASACFVNSERYAGLVGGRFASHGEGEFRARILDAQHPTMAGLTGFESWDETYRHNGVAADARVLMARVDDGPFEPWTWVRSQGRGRVFYTASGHDERTWKVAGFQDLVRRGVEWAGGRAKETAPPIEYEEVKIGPEYLPGGATVRVAKPLSPEASMQHMALPEDLTVECFASEPRIVKPVAMAFDERGRLWVVESTDYPDRIAPPGTPGHDRVQILEDTDLDGRADKFTVFAEGLNLAQGIAVVNGGCVVAAAPDILRLTDLDGDGKCDERKVLFTGFARGDTHAMHGNFRHGLDGWIYATCGYSGLDVSANGKRHRAGQCVFRFKADGDGFEILTPTSNNTWGVGFDGEGELFASTANGSHCVFVGVPNRSIESVDGFHAVGNATIEDHVNAHPVTADVKQVDFNGGYTAASDLTFYTGGLWPAEFRGNAFVCEPTMHLIHRDLVKPHGAGYVALDGYNLMASSDPWTAPIQTCIGPDGNVWFLDWYSPVVQHNPTPEGYRTAPGNAFDTPLRDRKHGRIYRIRYKDAAAAPLPNLSTTDGVKDAFANPNLFWRLEAERAAVQLRRAGGDASLSTVAFQAALLSDVPTTLHALRTLQCLGEVDELAARVARKVLTVPDSALVKTALSILPRDAISAKAILNAKLLASPDWSLRRHALLTLAEMPSSDAAGEAVAELLQSPAAADPWISLASIPAAARHASGFLRKALTRALDAAVADDKPEELAVNGSFDGEAASPHHGWLPVRYSGTAAFTFEPGRSGLAARIDSAQGADAGLRRVVDVEPRTRYRLSGWIRTEDVDVGTGFGALFNVHEFQSPRVKTEGVAGTRNWTRVAVEFESADQTRLSIHALFGGWGQSTGKAWFDDVKLERLGEAGGLDTAVRAVARHILLRSNEDALVTGLENLRTAPRPLKFAFLESLTGTALQPAPSRVKDAWISAMKSSVDDVRSAEWFLLAAESLGIRDEAFDGVRQAALSTIVRRFDSKNTPVGERLDAAKTLVAFDRDGSKVQRLTKALGSASSELAVGILAALRDSTQDSVAADVVKHYAGMSPAVRREALEFFLSREPFAAELVKALEEGRIETFDLDMDQRARLVRRRDPELERRAAKILAAVNDRNATGREALVNAKLALASKPGDLERGREAFRANCLVCHAVNGDGGKVGPELAGIHGGDRVQILTHILDPNRSVEGNYRRWLVWTKTGGAFAGRLVAETQNSLEILDSTGASRTFTRAEIDETRVEPFSLMPDGFEQLPDADLVNLVEYLASTRKPAAR